MSMVLLELADMPTNASFLNRIECHTMACHSVVVSLPAERRVQQKAVLGLYDATA